MVTTSGTRLGRQLEDGSYVVEVNLTRAADASVNKRLQFNVELIPHDGLHQKDQTIAYTVERLNTLVAPPGEVTLNYHVSDSADRSATEWSRSLGGIAQTWPYIQVCKKDSCTTNGDGYVVTVVINTSNHCKTSTACAGVQPSVSANDYHVGHVTIYIENPGYAKGKKYHWTMDPDLHNKKVPGNPRPPVTYYYLPTAMLHEFGHAVGLIDLYDIKNGIDFSDFLMGGLGSTTRATVPAVDRRYVGRIYQIYGHR